MDRWLEEHIEIELQASSWKKMSKCFTTLVSGFIHMKEAMKAIKEAIDVLELKDS